jgi:hypothetical protein
VKLMLSGEGPTDFGANRPGPGGTTFVPGPMACLFDALCEPTLGYSLLDLQQQQQSQPQEDFVRYLSRGDLSQRRQLRSGRPTLLPGQKRPAGLGGATAQAWSLGALAVEESGRSQQPVVASLFHDSDGTNAAPREHWQELVTAIRKGFELARCHAGVPMVPRPKSEAWLLCALKPDPYQHCDALEDAPGNDNSPNALKTRLAQLNGGEYPSGEEQADWVRTGRVDPARIDMPSFQAFTAQLDRVLTHVVSPSWRAPQSPPAGS